MSSFLIHLWSIEKSYTVSFKEISLCSFFVTLLICFLNKNYTILCYPQIWKFLFYLHTTNLHHHCNVNLNKISYFLKIETPFSKKSWFLETGKTSYIPSDSLLYHRKYFINQSKNYIFIIKSDIRFLIKIWNL